MSTVLDAIRQKYPEYSDKSDEDLALAIGGKYPAYLESDPAFKSEFNAAQVKGVKASPGEQAQLQSISQFGTPSPERVGEAEFTKATHGFPIIAPIAGVGAALNPLMKPVEEAGAKFFGGLRTATIPDLPASQQQVKVPDIVAGEPMLHTKDIQYNEGELSVMPPLARKLAVAYNEVLKTAEGFTTPGNALILPFAGESKAVQGTFLAQVASALPQEAEAVASAKTSDEKVAAWTHLMTTAGMAGLLTKGLARGETPNASRIQTPTTLHGDVREQPVQSERQVPVQESRPGVQPRPQTQTEVLLTAPESKKASPFRLRMGDDGSYQIIDPSGNHIETFASDNLQGAKTRVDRLQRGIDKPAPATLDPEEQAYLDEERKSMGVDVETVDTSAGAEEPFARKGSQDIAWGNRDTGKVQINVPVFKRWLATVPQARRSLAVRSLLHEEKLHLSNSDADAASYLETLSPVERRIAQRRYLGPNDTSTLSPEELGHEALRYRQQQLARMTPREIAEAALKERWTLKSLDAVDSVIKNMREVFGHESGDPIARAIIDRMASNVGAARNALTSSAKLKQQEEFDYNKLTQGEKVEYSFLHNQAMEARQAHEKLPTDLTADTLIDAELALQKFEGRKSLTTSGRLKKGKETAYKNVEEEPFLLPGMGTMTSKGIPGAEDVPSSERSAASEFSPPMTANQLESLSRGVLDELRESPTKAPDFDRWATRMGVRQPDLKRGQLAELWQRTVFDWVTKAKGEELSKMLTAIYGKEHIKGQARVIADPPTAEEMAQSKERTVYRSGSGTEKLGAETIRSAQGKRQKAMADIAYELVGPPMKEADLSRRKLSPDELRYGGGKDISAAQEFSPRDEQNPKLLASQLTDDYRRSKRDPVSVTKRVTAMMDRRTGRVYLVSTFEDGRRGAVLYDPGALQHTPLKDVLKRYRVLSSYLLDEPVKNFNQSFESLKDFNEKFGAEAKQRYIAETSYSPPPAAEFESGVEGTPGIEGEGGGFSGGPGKAQAAIEQGVTRGSVEQSRSRPLSDVEATAIQNHIADDLGGEPETIDDVRAVLDGLAMRDESQLPAAAMTGLSKIARMLQRENPKLTNAELIDLLAKRLYEDKNLEKTVAKSKAAFSAKTLTPAGTPESTGKELTSIRSKAPTTDPNIILKKGPTGHEEPALYEPKTVEMLSPRAQRSFARRVEVLEEQKKNVPPELHGAIRYWSPAEGKFVDKPDASYVPGERMRWDKEQKKWVPETTKGLTSSARLKLKDSAEEEYSRLAGQMLNLFKGHEAKRDIAGTRDGSIKNAGIRGENAKKAIELSSKGAAPQQELGLQQIGRREADKQAAMRRSAAIAIVSPEHVTVEGGKREAVGGMEKLQRFLNYCDLGITKAETMMESRKLRERIVGRKWKAAAEMMRKSVQYSVDNLKTDKPMWDTARAVRTELDGQFGWENANGSTTKEFASYFPGRYDAEFFNDNAVLFGDMRILGDKFKKNKSFENYYQAIANGPYIPASFDSANIVAHRVRQGSMAINNRLWKYSLAGLNVDGKPIAKPAKFIPMATVEDAEGVTHVTQHRWDTPDPDYVMVSADNQDSAQPIAVRKSFIGAVEALLSPSALDKRWPTAKALLQTQRALKHGAILVFDTYHPGRIGQFSLAGKGSLDWFNGGYSSLVYRPEDLGRAVEAGEITPRAASWARQNMDSGIRGVNTRQQLIQHAIAKGFNAVNIGDALFKDVVQQLRVVGPTIYKIVGPFNRWLFDKFLPGLVSESLVRNFESIRKANPDLDPNKLLQDVIRDMNTRYGSRGRQGIFRNQTAKDMAEGIFLAPQWQEGLIASELKFYNRLARSPFRLAEMGAKSLGMEKTAGVLGTLSGRKGLPQMGALGNGMLRGIAAYFAITQAINLATRGHSTFSNPEKDHELDAFMPLPGGEPGEGLWLSPLSVFAEWTHDIIRMHETKATTWEAIQKIGENKLGPIGKLALVLFSHLDPRSGEKITTSAGIAGKAAAQLAPVPIGLGAPARAIGHAAAPGSIKPNEPGQLARQALSSFAGIKTEVAQSPVQQVQKAAMRYVQDNGLKSEQFQMVPTDEPSYSKLRHAIAIGDGKTAKAVYEGLKKGLMRTGLSEKDADSRIIAAMDQWSRRPFTSNLIHEKAFQYSLDDAGRELYSKAQMQRLEMNEEFQNWIFKQP